MVSFDDHLKPGDLTSRIPLGTDLEFGVQWGLGPAGIHAEKGGAANASPAAAGAEPARQIRWLADPAIPSNSIHSEWAGRGAVFPDNLNVGADRA